MWADGVLVGVIMYGVAIGGLAGYLGWRELKTVWTKDDEQ